jgi:hypothetical protein
MRGSRVPRVGSVTSRDGNLRVLPLRRRQTSEGSCGLCIILGLIPGIRDRRGRVQEHLGAHLASIAQLIQATVMRPSRGRIGIDCHASLAA